MVYKKEFLPSVEVIKIHNHTLESKLASLTREIVTSQPKSKTDLEKLYQDVVLTLIIRSGVGHPANGAVIRETHSALVNICPIQSFPQRFLTLPPLDKSYLLSEWCLTTTGLRIYNWDCKKGGAGVPDLPGLLFRGIEKALFEDDVVLKCLEEKIAYLTAITEACLFTNHGLNIEENLVRNHKFGLLSLRQYQVFATCLLKETEQCQMRMYNLDQDLLSCLSETQKILANHLEVVSEEVYPLFKRLACIWQSFQNETIILSRISTLKIHLRKYTNCVKKLPSKSLVEKLKLNYFPTDEEREETNSIGKMINQEAFLCKIVYPGDVDNFHLIKRQLSGFCPVTLVVGKGFLLKGNNRLALLNYQEKYYCCSTIDRLEKFGRQPGMFLAELEKLMHNYPSLAQLCEWTMDDRRRQDTGT